MGILLTQRSGLIIGNIAKILGFIMNAIYEVLSNIGIENLGLCIVLFTIIIYTLMLPMTIKQQKTSKMMAVMNPEIQAVQKKYANKRDQASMAKMQEEMNLIYEKYGTSPTSGCLGSVIQLPIFFALWPVVQNIPAYVGGLKEAYMPLVDKIMATDGYIKVMEAIGSAKPILVNPDQYSYEKANTIVDVLYKFQDSTWDTLADKFPDLTNLIYETKETITGMNYFCGINIAESPSSMLSAAMKDFSIGLIIVAILIPVLAGVSQWLSAKIMQNVTGANNKNKKDDNPMMQQMDMMLKIMPLMSVFMCFTMPSGLGIYWITSAVVRTIQQVMVNKQLSKKSVDEIVTENLEKSKKKHAKKDAVSSQVMNEMAQKKTRQTTSNNNIDSYKANAKPGSLASKANMVSDFNNRKN